LTTQPHFIPLIDGEIRSIVSSCALNSVMVFVRGSVVSSSDPSTMRFLAPLFAGYIGRSTFAGYPFGGYNSQSRTFSKRYVVDGVDPAAGAEFSLINTAGLIQRLVGIQFKLVTDVNVANRTVRVAFRFGSFERVVFGTVQVASETKYYEAYVNFPFEYNRDYNGIDEVFVTALPDNWEMNTSNHRINIEVENMQAGDQLSQIILHIDRWFNDEIN